MKLLILCGEYPPKSGGVSDYTFFLANELFKNHNVCVTVITGEGGQQNNSGITVVPFVRSWNIPTTILLISRFIRTNRFDLVNLQYVPQLYGRTGICPGIILLLIIIKLWFRLPIVATCHELYGHFNTNLLNNCLQIIYRIQLYLLLIFSTSIIVPTEGYKRKIKGVLNILRTPLYQIPVGSNIPVYVSNEENRLIMRKQLISKDHFLMGIFGRWHSWANYELAFRTLRGLLDRGRHVSLLCIGELGGTKGVKEPLMEVVKELGLENDVIFTGYLSNEDVSRYLNILDLYLFTREEGPTSRNTTLIAAMAHGVPIISTMGIEPDNIFLQSNAMLFIKSSQLHELPGLIERVIDNPSLQGELRSKARSLFEKEFSWGKIAKRTLLVLNRGVA